MDRSSSVLMASRMPFSSALTVPAAAATPARAAAVSRTTLTASTLRERGGRSTQDPERPTLGANLLKKKEFMFIATAGLMQIAVQ